MSKVEKLCQKIEAYYLAGDGSRIEEISDIRQMLAQLIVFAKGEEYVRCEKIVKYCSGRSLNAMEREVWEDGYKT